MEIENGQGLRMYKQDLDVRIVASEIVAMKKMRRALGCCDSCRV